MSRTKQCPYCLQDFDVRGARLHIALCPKNPNSAKFEKIKVDERPEKIEDNLCNHNWELIKPTSEVAKLALDAGYKKYCTICEEIEK